MAARQITSVGSHMLQEALGLRGRTGRVLSRFRDCGNVALCVAKGRQERTLRASFLVLDQPPRTAEVTGKQTLASF